MNKAILRGLEILKFVGESEEPVTIAELSRYLDIPKTSVFNIVGALVEKNYLSIKDKKLKSYELGIGALELGTLYMNKAELVNISDPVLKWLVDNVSETVFLAVANNDELIYINKKESKNSLRTTGNLGSRNPLYSTSLGKAILASYSEVEVNRYIEHVKLLPQTENTIIDKEALLEDLKKIKQRGYSISDEENEKGIYCIAAPIYNSKGKAIGSLCISSLKIKVDDKRTEIHKDFVIKAALEISRKLGYTKDRLY
ncbi:IclR family transcriptional regulator [Clostridiaceae bacterium UIB06]|uniref:IclR family transcriptional regulator n=1 Tax=Clostridium thailandense TaxID=2794346 RepID=A0A949WTX0_9CLOT|nr:IclR family transcriptional regulator [Clostridium thailandense]MCH5137719.1 IclR family transcriptional regulator [Clostridiaceae bacterium UIB06]